MNGVALPQRIRAAQRHQLSPFAGVEARAAVTSTSNDDIRMARSFLGSERQCLAHAFQSLRGRRSSDQIISSMRNGLLLAKLERI